MTGLLNFKNKIYSLVFAIFYVHYLIYTIRVLVPAIEQEVGKSVQGTVPCLPHHLSTDTKAFVYTLVVTGHWTRQNSVDRD